MSTPVYISRNFVEFGPFKPEEVVDFHTRGILGELDHVREDGQDDWHFIGQWIEKAPKAAPPKTKPSPVPAAKKAAAKAATKTTTKVAAKKAAKK